MIGIRINIFLTGICIGTLSFSVTAQTNTFPTSGNVGIGTTSPSNPLSVNGVIKAGGNYYNVLTYALNSTPANGTKIVTGIPYQSSAEMPTVIIEGYNYGATEPIGLMMNWYIYNGSFTSYAVTSFGAYTPQIQLSDENGYVVIFINDTPYFERFAVRAYANGESELPTWFNGWSAVDQPVTGSNTVTLPYKNNFAGTLNVAGTATFSNATISGSLNLNAFASTVGYSTYTSDGLFGSTATPSKWITPSHDYGVLGYADGGDGEYVPRIGFYAAYVGSPTNQAASETSIGLEPMSSDFTIRGGATNNEYARVLNSNGNVGLGTSTPAQKLEVSGNIQVDGGIYFPGSSTPQTVPWTGVVCGGDYAESVDVTGDRRSFAPGDVLVIDPDSPGKFLKSGEAYSSSVTGIYSTKPGTVGRRQKTPYSPDEVPMAMMGIVPVKATAENGAIRPGDLLVSSSKIGYAMKGTDRSRMLGAVIGKALGSLDSGTGELEVVVTLQ